MERHAPAFGRHWPTLLAANGASEIVREEGHLRQSTATVSLVRWRYQPPVPPRWGTNSARFGWPRPHRPNRSPDELLSVFATDDLGAMLDLEHG